MREVLLSCKPWSYPCKYGLRPCFLWEIDFLKFTLQKKGTKPFKECTGVAMLKLNILLLIFRLLF